MRNFEFMSNEKLDKKINIDKNIKLRKQKKL